MLLSNLTQCSPKDLFNNFEANFKVSYDKYMSPDPYPGTTKTLKRDFDRAFASEKRQRNSSKEILSRISTKLNTETTKADYGTPD